MENKPQFCPECGTERGEASICEKCGYEYKVNNKVEIEAKKKVKENPLPDWNKYESFFSIVGQWAWIIILIDAIIYLFLGIWVLAWGGVIWIVWAGGIAYGVWLIICAITTAALAILIVKPRFSDKCASKDWNFILNDVVVLGNIRIPLMLIFGIILEVVGQWWGGLPILIPMIFLLFAGPKRYNWKVEK
jgi:hypothetical protein